MYNVCLLLMSSVIDGYITFPVVQLKKIKCLFKMAIGCFNGKFIIVTIIPKTHFTYKLRPRFMMLTNIHVKAGNVFKNLTYIYILPYNYSYIPIKPWLALHHLAYQVGQLNSILFRHARYEI